MSDVSRILVTGGAGFIGHRAVADLLSVPGRHVAVLDNLSVGLPMQEETDRLRVFAGDVTDEAFVLQVFNEFRPEAVMHLAAVHHIPTCEKRRAYALDANVVGTEIVLDAAEKSATKRFLLASSGAVYDWSDGALDEGASPLRAADNYALSKLTNEQQLAFWAERTGGEARIARIFNTIGHDDPNAHLIPDVLNQIKRSGGKATIELGNLTPRRDYIHADDTARGLVAIATAGSLGSGTEIFNVCSGVEASVEDLVRTIGAAMDTEIEVRQSEARRRRVDRPSQLGNPERIRRALGWTTRVPFDQAIADIVARFKFAE